MKKEYIQWFIKSELSIPAFFSKVESKKLKRNKTFLMSGSHRQAVRRSYKLKFIILLD